MEREPPSGRGRDTDPRFVLPAQTRAALATPLGRVLGSREAVAEGRRAACLALVGDVTTDTFVEAGVLPRLMVVDHRTKRRPSALRSGEKLKSSALVRVQASNPPGVITWGLWRAVAEAYGRSGSTLVEVEGEEDLAALPAIALAPPGGLVCYGQPDAGVVVVKADEARGFVTRLLKKMEVS